MSFSPVVTGTLYFSGIRTHTKMETGKRYHFGTHQFRSLFVVGVFMSLPSFNRTQSVSQSVSKAASQPENVTCLCIFNHFSELLGGQHKSASACDFGMGEAKTTPVLFTAQ